MRKTPPSATRSSASPNASLLAAQNPSKLRTDIHVLRGVAILTVLLYHAELGGVAAGYLGVDIFFVISGFLITSLIRDGIHAGRFTLTAFYFRRAKRLLPAAYVTFLLTVAAAPFFLTRLEMVDFFHQVLGAITFTANFVLWQQAGYFEGAADLKPLLHTWSLAVEEQYYLLLPAMMLLFPRRLWLRLALAAFLLSLAVAVVFSGAVAAVFYLLPGRAWELMLGSIGALLLSTDRLTACARFTFWPALAAMLLLPLVGLRHSGFDFGALLICLATFIIILRRHSLLATGSVMSGLGKIGDMSYSLYLVHWPLFAFFNNAWVTGTNRQATTVRLGLLATSFILGYLLHRFVERPIHYAVVKRPTRFLVGLGAASVVLLAIAAGVTTVSENAEDYAFTRRPNVGFSAECEFTREFAPLPACRNSDTPEVLVWGDSYAMHLVPGVARAPRQRPFVVQATKSVCGPLLDVAYVADNEYNRAWAERCIRFNESVVEYLTATDSVKTVVLSSAFVQFLDPGQLLKRGGGGRLRVVSSGLPEALAGLRRTVDTVRATGKRVVIIAPPPAEGFDVGRCLERLERRLPTFSTGGRCLISQKARAELQGEVLQLLALAPAYTDANVIKFDSLLCDAAFCKTRLAGVSLYRDDVHFSYEGSSYVATKMGLGRRIDQLAR